MGLTPYKIAGLLKQRGYRMTLQRRAVLDAIARTEEYLSPASIYEKVARKNPGIGLVTVYRTLEILADLGLLCKVHTGGNCRGYLMSRPSEHHHHVVCSGCGRVVDFTDCVLDELEKKLSRGTGFKLENHLLEFVGRCPDCQKPSPVAAAAQR
ncbi:MAG: Fur family transcriptional regulator [Dehalococcoidia bacterium]|nr:Fur family transcriptional regulator [Dehalococcoidia bacterium]